MHELDVLDSCRCVAYFSLLLFFSLDSLRSCALDLFVGPASCFSSPSFSLSRTPPLTLYATHYPLFQSPVSSSLSLAIALSHTSTRHILTTHNSPSAQAEKIRGGCLSPPSKLTPLSGPDSPNRVGSLARIIPRCGVRRGAAARRCGGSPLPGSAPPLASAWRAVVEEERRGWWIC